VLEILAQIIHEGVGIRHQVLGAGDIFETPDHDTPRGEAEIMPLVIAA